MAALKEVSAGDMAGVLDWIEDEAVSTYFVSFKSPSIFEAGAGIALNDTFVKLVSLQVLQRFPSGRGLARLRRGHEGACRGRAGGTAKGPGRHF